MESDTLLKFNSLPLTNNSWKTILSFWVWSLFRGKLAVKLQVGKVFFFPDSVTLPWRNSTWGPEVFLKFRLRLDFFSGPGRWNSRWVSGVVCTILPRELTAGSPENHPERKRKLVFHPPPFWGSRLVFGCLRESFQYCIDDGWRWINFHDAKWWLDIWNRIGWTVIPLWCDVLYLFNRICLVLSLCVSVFSIWYVFPGWRTVIL